MPTLSYKPVRLGWLILFASLLLGAGWVAASGRLFLSPAPKTIWLIGDSLSRGLYASSEANTYRAILERELNAPITRIAGCNVRKALEQVAQAETWPEVVFIEVGINDLRETPAQDQESCPWLPPEEFPAAYHQLVDTLEAHGVLVIAGTIPWSGWQPEDAIWPRIQTFNQVIRQSTPHIADLWTATLYAEDQLSQPDQPSAFGPGYQGDRFHPSDAGHRRIAQVFLKAYGEATR